MFAKEGKIGRAVGPGVLLVLLTALISGVSTFVNAYGVQGMNSDAFVTVRNLTVAAMLVPLAVLARGSLRRSIRRRDWARLLVIGFIGGFVPFLLFFHGLQMATGAGGATTASFGYRTLFLMATVLGVVFLRERLSARTALAAGLLLAGNFLLLAVTSPVWTDGTAFVLLATAMWAGEYTLSKRTLRDLSPGTVALARMGIGGLFLTAYLGLTGQFGAIAAMSGPQWQWVALSALLLLAFVTTWYAGLKHVDVSVATAVLVLGFPITFALEVLVRNRAFTAGQAAGAVAIVFGVALAIGLASMKGTWIYLAKAVRSRIRSGT